MHYTTIRRIAFLLALLLAGACVWFAWSASSRARAGSPTSDETVRAPVEEVFQARCAGCHEVNEFSDALRDHEQPARAVLEYLEFLAEHGTTDAVDDRRLVADWVDRSTRP